MQHWRAEEASFKNILKILSTSTFFLCRDGEAILEIRGTLPLAGPGGDLKIWNSWKKNEMWRGDNMASKWDKRRREGHSCIIFSDSRSSTFFGSCEARRKHQSLISSSILDNWYIRLMADNCFRALKRQAKSFKNARIYSAFFTEFAQCCHARYEWEVNAPRIMCPECQNVYISVRFGQWKVEEPSYSLWNKKKCRTVFKKYWFQSLNQLYGHTYCRSYRYITKCIFIFCSYFSASQ